MKSSRPETAETLAAPWKLKLHGSGTDLLFLCGLGRLLEILGSRGTLAAMFPHALTGTGLDPVPLLLDVDVKAFSGVSHQ